MDAIGQELRVYREFKGYSPEELARKIKSNQFIDRKLVPFEIKPTVCEPKKLADFLKANVSNLLVETKDREILKDPTMTKRLNDIAKFSAQEKIYILYAFDSMINNVK